ncbi:unnamed protein product [Phaedon cochleariae]|uniref:Thiamin pyrophosphokinase thiamin-binding domain-containing protein n=1 Tax=Phaedon cochleariae TaxID=80249 RepID=A0A9N9SDF5_PHACE|nr:unnamed protein product [Phaedon cochleariae]
MNCVDQGINKTMTWSPCEELTTEFTRNHYGIIILNSPINFSFHQEFVIRMWRQAKVRVTVDGGTDRWQHWLTMNEHEFKDVPNPDLITGDMDSLSKEVLNHFTDCGTKVVVTPDQNETDYVKALVELNKYCCSENIELDTVYVLADTCGRFDQIMANINALFRSRDILKGIRIYQIASTSLTWLLDEGFHSISIPEGLVSNRDWCALIPIGGPCQVSTTGLKWDLDNTKLEFGDLVSTSNTYGGPSVITVKTNSPVIWSMSIDSLL